MNGQNLINGFQMGHSPGFFQIRNEKTIVTARQNLKIASGEAAVLTMEHLFSPCTRLHDLWQDFENIKELKLDVSAQELLSAERGFTYADMYAMLGNGATIAWFTPNASIVRAHGRALNYAVLPLQGVYRSGVTANGKAIVVLGSSMEAVSEICDVVLRLLVVSTVHSVRVSIRSGLVFLSMHPLWRI
jgi:hypothetical protein